MLAKKRSKPDGATLADLNGSKSCADTLAQHKDRFDVTLVEAAGYCGGQAFSIEVDADRYGAGWINQGVQGGSPIFVSVRRELERLWCSSSC